LKGLDYVTKKKRKA